MALVKLNKKENKYNLQINQLSYEELCKLFVLMNTTKLQDIYEQILNKLSNKKQRKKKNEKTRP